MIKNSLKYEWEIGFKPLFYKHKMTMCHKKERKWQLWDTKF